MNHKQLHPYSPPHATAASGKLAAGFIERLNMLHNPMETHPENRDCRYVVMF